MIAVERLRQLRRRWKLAGWLADAEQAGRTLMDVPADLVAEVQELRWHKRVERAAEKWAADVAEVPLSDYQAAMNGAGPRLEGRHRGHRGGKL